MEKITVSAEALKQLLYALIGNGHEIRELQVTRGLPGGKNPIDILIGEYNEQAEAHRANANPG